MTGKDVRNDVFGQYYKELVTEHEILKENHETLKKDYEVLEKSSKHVTEISEVLRVHQQNQSKELETKLECLVKDLEKEKSEKEVLKQEMEGMKSKSEKEQKELKKILDKCGKLESEKEELKKQMERMKSKTEKEEKELNKMFLKKKVEKIEIEKEVLKKKNQELLNGKEKEEKKLKKMKEEYAKLAKNCQSEKAEKEAMIDELENKYVKLGEELIMVEKECSYVKSLYDAEKLTDNVDNATADLIVNLDDSDAESDAVTKSNKVPQRSFDIKQEQQPNSSKGNHLPSSPSSLSSDEFVIKRGSVKRPRMQ